MAFAATVTWDVRTTGSDSNGGGFDPISGTPGTNYSVQDSPQITYTDLVIDGTTNTKCTSAGNPFTSAHVGNVINITSGTGFTVQRVQVMSVTGSAATVDKSLGTLSSTGGNGKLGGGLQTIATANGLCVAGNSVYIKSGTYTLTTAVAISVTTFFWSGYQTTHGDNGTRPLITTSTNSTILVTTSASTGVQSFTNISFSNTAGTRAAMLQQVTQHAAGSTWVLSGCIIDGFTKALDSSNNGAAWDVGFITLDGCEVKNCTASGVDCTSSATVSLVSINGCYFHGNAANISTDTAGVFIAINSIFSGTTGDGIGPSTPYVFICGCTSYGNSNGIALSGTVTGEMFLMNNICYGNTTRGITSSSAGNNTAYGALVSKCNAYGGNGTNLNNWTGSTGDVVLSANPFTNSAGGDFSLNNTAGGGAACRGAGYIGAFPGGTSTGAPDIGAVQQSTSGGGSGGNSGFSG